MTGSMNFWDIEVWQFVIMISVIFLSLIVANALRRTVKPLRRSLIPSSVIAGFTVLIADRIYRHFAGSSMFSGVTLEALTYHGLGLGIVAMTLRRTGKRDKAKQARVDVFNSGVLTVSTYLVQAIVGLVISVALFYLIGSWAASGILLPMGYGQGPGQAYNWGHTYEVATDYLAFEDGTSFGLSVAAMGFVSASVGGIIYLNRLKKKGKVIVENAEEIEDLSAETVTEKGEIPLSESLDKLTVQFAMTFICYFAAFGTMYGLSLVFDYFGGFLENTVKPLLWGFNFLVGMLFAVGLKGVMNGLRRKKVIHREYLNNFMLNRISGMMFDLMVVASIAAIDLSAFANREFILPLVLICGAGALATYFFLNWVSKKLFPDYAAEEFLGMYGMLTGTMSTGIILLREIDPLYKTPASNNLIYQNMWAIVFGFPILLLMGFVARSLTWTFITLGILAVLFTALMLILFRGRLKRKKGTAQGRQSDGDVRENP